MNLLSREHDGSYCFDPNELFDRSNICDNITEVNIDDDQIINQDDDGQIKWLIQFIKRNQNVDLYSDLVKFNQFLLENTLDAVQKNYDKCIEFGRQVSELNTNLCAKLASFKDLRERQPKCVSNKLSALNELIDERKSLIFRRRTIEQKIIEYESNELLSAIKYSKYYHNDVEAIAILAAYLLPDICNSQENQSSELVETVRQALLNNLYISNDDHISRQSLILCCYNMLKLLPNFREIVISLQNEISSNNRKEESLADLRDNVKSLCLLLITGHKESESSLQDANLDNSNIKSIFETLILPNMCKRARKLLSAEKDQNVFLKSDGCLYGSAENMSQSITVVKNELIRPLEEWLHLDLMYCYDEIFHYLGISPNIYYSMYTAEMQRDFESAIVLCDDYGYCATSIESIKNTVVHSNDILIPCDQVCCLVHNSLFRFFKVCYTHEHQDIVDIRSCLIKLSARYFAWIEGKLKMPVDNSNLIHFCLLTCRNVIRCLSFLDEFKISSSFKNITESVDIILKKRLNTLKENLIFPKLAKLLCNKTLFSQVENIPTLLIRKQQTNVRTYSVDESSDKTAAQQASSPHLSSSYIENAFTQLKKYWKYLPTDNYKLHDYLICTMCDNFMLTIQQTLKAIKQVENGLAKLRKSKYSKDTSRADTFSTICNQLTSDVAKFNELINSLYSSHQIDLSDTVKNSMKSLDSAVDESQCNTRKL